MKAKSDCIVCMFRQALNTVRLVSDDPDTHLRVLTRLAEQVSNLSLDQTPANLSGPAYTTVTEITGVEDPYKEQKRESNKIALQMLPKLRRSVQQADDPLDAALHSAVAGNIIDLGIDKMNKIV